MMVWPCKMRAIASTPAKLLSMARARALLSVPALILLAGTAQCGSTSDAPPGQALLYIDTDAPAAARASVEGQGFLAEAAVDTLRVDILDPNNVIVRSVDIPAPDEANWPVSFGLQGMQGVSVTRLRLRAFRAQRSQIATDLETGAKVFEPIAGYTIDRVLELPVPHEKGVFAFRVVLRSACRGNRPDFTRRTTCVSRDLPDAGFREGLQSVEASPAPVREKMWWPSNPDRGSPPANGLAPDCPADACREGSVCIPGGSFMLGNLRVVGFGALQRHDAVPAHPISMRPFCIDANEKTVAEYQALMAGPNHLSWPTGEGGAPYLPPPSLLCTWSMPAFGTGTAYPPDAPMNCVDHDDAARACEAAGGRLPTEAEWEYVATGMGRGTLFPWGDAPPDCEAAVLERQETDFKIFPQCEGSPSLEAGTTLSVGRDRAFVRWKPPGADPNAPREAEEVWHLAGSLSEWMLDAFVDYGDTDSATNCWQLEGPRNHPACNATGTTMSVRGGNFIDDLEVAYSALRFDETDLTHTDFIGFRCVYPIGGVDPVQKHQPTSDIDAGAPGTDGGGIDQPPREGGP